jgi:phage terminase small subunit
VVTVADKLTPKQQRFAWEYMVDFNGTQAAIRAGYSAKTAQEQASRLLSNVMVSAEIQRLGQKTATKLEITRESIMQELAAVGFARVSDFVHVETVPEVKPGIHPLTGEVINIPGGGYQTVRITDTDELPEDKAAALAGIKQGANGIDVKLHDKVRALELLGKAVGLFEKADGTQQGIEDLTPLVELLKDD